MSIRVFLVDDHTVFRQGLRGLLEEEPGLVVTGEADDGLTALEALARSQPDVVLMDVNMAGLNGVETTRQLARTQPQLKVVALSMHVDERFVAEMLRAGAVGYLCKKCDADEVVAAIRAAHAGQTYLSPAISGALVEGYIRNRGGRAVRPASPLTAREREVLHLLVADKTVKEVASELNLSVKTVHAHREKLMEKLGVHSLVGLTKHAIREGLIDA